MFTRRIIPFLLLLIVFTVCLQAQEEVQMPADAVTRHSISIDGQEIKYTARAGLMPIRDANGKTVAHIFYMAYTKDGVSDMMKRPLMFSMNGGPSTASIWLHMGVFGPKIVKFDDDGFALQPPFTGQENHYSILDETDLVFIDPIGTGYSRMMPGEDKHMFHGENEDIEALGEFIRMYTTRNNRWQSPKFLVGESYGTTRASGLAGYLQDRFQMHLNGVILVSSMELNVDVGSDLNFALILPHYTATAWYHKQLPSDLQSRELRDILDEVEAFALDEYLKALVKGGYVPDAEKADIVRKLARYTGLSEQYIINTNLRVTRSRFRKELLRNEHRTVGRLDSRYKGIDRDSAGETYEFDQSLIDWEGTFAATFNDYIRKELRYEVDMPYEIWGDVRPWKRDPRFNVGEMLRRAMTENTHLRVQVLEGYYDAACDYFTALYAFSHIDMNGELKDRIEFCFYESGHMMYAHKPSLIKMKEDVARFIRSALPY